MFEVRYYPKGLGSESKEIKKTFEKYKEAKKFFNNLKFVYKYINCFFEDYTFVGNTKKENSYSFVDFLTTTISFDINGNRLKENNLKALFIKNKDLSSYHNFMNQKN